MPGQIDEQAPHDAQDTITESTARLSDTVVDELIVACDATSDTAQSEQDFDQLGNVMLQQAAELSGALSQRTDADALLTAAILASDEQTKLDLLLQAIETGTQEPIVLWHAMTRCLRSNDARCSTAALEERLLAVDGQNSESWMHIAAGRFSRGQTDDALHAVRQAAAAPESHDFFVDTVRLVLNALSASDIRAQHHMSAAIGFAAAGVPSYLPITQMCRDQGQLQDEWAYACAAYAQTSAKQNKTQLSVMISLAIAQSAYETLGDLRLAERTEAQRFDTRTRFRNTMPLSFGTPQRGFTSNATIDLDGALYSSQTLSAAFLDAIEQHGELHAREQFYERVAHHVDRDNRLRCHRWTAAK
ncbi:MAG: hypothetical protein AAF465_03785 [Pseudomonadota bacterium]